MGRQAIVGDILGGTVEWDKNAQDQAVSNEAGQVCLETSEIFQGVDPADRKAGLYILHQQRLMGAVVELSGGWTPSTGGPLFRVACDGEQGPPYARYGITILR